ncbi:MAG: neutral/alkaline non-lysosomal ceramidase N-terminal domain-containing protein [Planctomycetota bacterium]|nr:neutral/alkaline non-lysosomal ceramidase N-terminal domain-containing protein [Planctomycetota bacterium]MDA1211365.1 neutral/alkaline non-lysosomal ceramidase N-terminal domain-containing protein [Planctomycetota bacterium]
MISVNLHRRSFFVTIVTLTLSLSGAAATVPAADWEAGVAKIVITPEEPIFMDGYGGRDHPAEGTLHDLWAKATAMKAPNGHTVVFVGLDLVGVPIKMTDFVSAEIEKRHGLKRDQLMYSCSHTHTGPALDHNLSHMLDMSDEDWNKVLAYQDRLNRKVITVIEQALADMKPAKLEFGNGRTNFATPRRPPIGIGPYDHEVPVLKISSLDGKTLRGLIFGYACHSTVLSFYQFSGDYPGFAMIYLEERHPDTVAMFFAGCGADQNPLPRRKIELAEKYGRMLGIAVEEVIRDPMTPLTENVSSAFQNIDLAWDHVPTTEELQASVASSNVYDQRRGKFLLDRIEKEGELSPVYPYPVQVWRFGDQLTWVTLGGEVVVDYSIRIKAELGQGKTWVTGYANDVMCYIPSERVLKEGGYEGASSMIVYNQPSPWRTGLEDQIVETVHALFEKTRAKSE